MYFVLLRQHNGKPWDGLVPRMVDAPNADAAARAAYPVVPSSHNVNDAYAIQVVTENGIEVAFSVELDVPKPKWKPSRPARPQARTS
jgi:hypothetical protein